MAALTVFAIPDIHVLNPSIVLSEHDGLLMDWNRIAFPNADWQCAVSCVRVSILVLLLEDCQLMPGLYAV